MKKILAYIVVLLVSAQTFAAVADVQQSHQSGSEHIEFNHEKDTNNNVLAEKGLPKFEHPASTPNNSPTNSYDCNHCCHCHSCHTHILIRENLLKPQSLSFNSSPTGIVNSAQIGILSQPYRPPRV